MTGVALLLVCLGLGHAIKWLAGLPLPPNVIGLALLFGALRLGLIKLAWIERTSEFLVRHMMLFFIPSVVGAAFVGSAFPAQWPALGISLVASTIAGLLVAAGIAHRMNAHDPGKPPKPQGTVTPL